MPRRLLVALPLALVVFGSPAVAQTASGDAVRGKALFDNPATASGNPGLPTCSSCHGSVEARRSVVSQNSGGAADPYADITFDMAMTRLSQALQRQEMAAFRVLTAQQVYDLGAYLADTPKTNPASESQINLVAALNTSSTPRTVTLTHARATSENLVVSRVELFGTGAANFVIGNRQNCEGVTLAPAQSCSVTVTFAPTSSGVSTADLVLTMRQGPSTNPSFERVLSFSGAVSGGSSSDDGGGALGLGWLLALGAAVAGLSRRRCRA